MSGKAGGGVDNLITKLSMLGVAEIVNDQNKITKGYKAMQGGISGLRAEWQSMSGLQKAGVGAGMAAAGAGLMAYTRHVFDLAAVNDMVDAKLTQTMTNGKRNTLEAVESVKKLTESMSAASGKTPFGDEALKDAATMLATFKMSGKEIESVLPSLADVATVMTSRGGGEFGDNLQRIAIMIGKVDKMGMASAMRRIGIDIDPKLLKANGRQAIIDELQKEFGGVAQAAMNTGKGAMIQFADAMEEVNKAIGKGLLLFTPLIRKASGLLNGLRALVESTHGVAGAMLGIVATALLLGGAFIAASPGILAFMAMQDRMREKALQTSTALAIQGDAALSAGVKSGEGAAAGMAGMLGKVGGFMKGGGGMTIAGIAAMLGGGYLSGMADKSKELMFEQAKKNGGNADSGTSTKYALEKMGGGALQGAGIGAMIGSVIPGIGNILGAVMGAATGMVVAGIQGQGDRADLQKRFAGMKKDTPTVNLPGEVSDYLKEIAKNTKEAKQFGGGDRLRQAIPQSALATESAFAAFNRAVG